jgi:acetoin utilization deacetylase AcuC-like enzyme
MDPPVADSSSSSTKPLHTDVICSHPSEEALGKLIFEQRALPTHDLKPFAGVALQIVGSKSSRSTSGSGGSGGSGGSSDSSRSSNDDVSEDDQPFTPKFFGIDEDAWICINCIANCFGGNCCSSCFQPRHSRESLTSSSEQPDLTLFSLNKDITFAAWARPKPVITGYCYDSAMELHEAENLSKNGVVDVHVERPDRVRCVNQHLKAQGILDRMAVVPSRWATYAEICSVHSPELFSELKSTHGKTYVRVFGCPLALVNGLYEPSSDTSGGKPVYYNTAEHLSVVIQHDAEAGEWHIKESKQSGSLVFARIACLGSLESCAALSAWRVAVADEAAQRSGSLVDLELDSSNYSLHPQMCLRVECSKTGSHRDGSPIDGNTYVGPHSFQAAVMAVGCVLSVAQAVHTGAISNGIAVVRPPGHHAKKEASEGFCLLNNVAVAAKVATTLWGLERVAILDWDIHHGNGTEDIFYDDPNVLVINMHRFDNHQFYPGTGSPDRIGVGEGKGFNINIGWQSGGEGGLSDSDYLAAMRVIVLPIIEQFKPSLLFISAGFDAAMGDPLGQCRVTCAGYAQMTQLLSSACNGRVVVVIEGGYNLTAVANSSEAVVNSLQHAVQTLI